MNISKIILFCLILNCSFLFNLEAGLFSDTPKYEKPCGKLKKEFIKEMRTQKNLITVGVGGGGNFEKINNIDFSFDSNENLNISETRKLVVEVAENLLSKINNNLDLRPYLQKYPSNSKNIRFQIMFPDREIHDPQIISGVSLIEGVIRYRRGENLELVHDEKYQDALKIIKASTEVKETSG